MKKAMKYILDEHGEPLACEDIMQWGNWFEGSDRRVALTVLNEKGGEPVYMVSTVFLGVDYGWGNSIPIFWETMVFKGSEGLWFDRCGGSREQAEAMHESVCRKVLDKAANAKSRTVDGMV
jgi:hypothetical protein